MWLEEDARRCKEEYLQKECWSGFHSANHEINRVKELTDMARKHTFFFSQ